VAPAWAPLLTKIAKLGAHIFYRWPGGWGQPGAFTGRYIGEPRDPLSMRPPMPAPTLEGDGTAVQIAQADAGPPVPRAADDVGGLLDTSKGWTLNIPAPDDSGSAAARMIASQQGKLPAPQVAAASAGVTTGSK
jgi:hypothetical protein